MPGWLNYVATESAAPQFAWLGLIVLVNVYWTFYDFVLAPMFRWEMMTTEYREGLNNPVFGPFIFGGTVLTVAAFFWHMINLRVRTGR